MDSNVHVVTKKERTGYPYYLHCGKRLNKEYGTIISAFKQEQKEKGIDDISHPAHYCFGKYEPVKVIQDWGLSFCCGNVLKYLARAGKKDGNTKLQDLKKARQYLDFEIEEIENESGN